MKVGLFLDILGIWWTGMEWRSDKGPNRNIFQTFNIFTIIKMK